MIVQRNAVLRAHGAVRGELFMEFVDAGFNYRLSDVHAAIGLAQVQK
ncbi:DegT/DnrJ/EryC1/StrS family aminotransferase, partial [Streptomyces hydrogenans]